MVTPAKFCRDSNANDANENVEDCPVQPQPTRRRDAAQSAWIWYEWRRYGPVPAPDAHSKPAPAPEVHDQSQTQRRQDPVRRATPHPNGFSTLGSPFPPQAALRPDIRRTSSGTCDACTRFAGEAATQDRNRPPKPVDPDKAENRRQTHWGTPSRQPIPCSGRLHPRGQRTQTTNWGWFLPIRPSWANRACKHRSPL